MNALECRTLPPFDAVVFDLDGLLLDSEAIALKAMQAAAQEQGIELPAEVRLQMIGVPADTCRRLVADRYGDAVEIERLFVSATRHLEACVQAGELRVKPGVAALLDALDHLRLPRAVATSSSRHRALHHLETAGLLHRLDEVVTRDDVTRGKPHPDLFLEASRRLGQLPARCLAFEDSYNGVLAAVSAGMPVVMVPDLLAPTAQMHAIALRVVASLEEVLPCFSAARPAKLSP